MHTGQCLMCSTIRYHTITLIALISIIVGITMNITMTSIITSATTCDIHLPYHA